MKNLMTNTLLFVIAIGLWANILVRPRPVHAQGESFDLSAIEGDLSDLNQTNKAILDELKVITGEKKAPGATSLEDVELACGK